MSRAPGCARWGQAPPTCWQRSGCARRRGRSPVCRPLTGTAARPAAAEAHSAATHSDQCARPVRLLRRLRAVGAPPRRLAWAAPGSAARVRRDCGPWFAAAAVPHSARPAASPCAPRRAIRRTAGPAAAARRERTVAPHAALLPAQGRAAAGPRAQRRPPVRLSAPLHAEREARAEQVRRELPALHVGELRALAARLRLLPAALRPPVSRSLPRGE